MDPAENTTVQAERTYTFSLAGPFEWLRVDAGVTWRCSRCEKDQQGEIPVFVEWLDRAASEAQARSAEGLTCRGCEHLEPLDVPLLQYRQADAIGLMVGLPPRTAREEDEAAIRDTLAVAHSKRELEGAGIVAAVRMGWWKKLWSQPLGPRLAGAVPLVLPESEEEAERWRSATVAALGLPDVRSSLNEFFSCDEEDSALGVLRRCPELTSPRWRRTVEALCELIREAQQSPEARRAVSARAAFLRQVRLLGVEQAGHGAVTGRLEALVETATGEGDHTGRLAALRSIVKSPEARGHSALGVAARLAYVQALHGDPGRRAADDGELVELARETLVDARREMGAEHEMTSSATLNLAVCIEEEAGADPSGALTEALGLLEELAPRAARSGSPIVADVATNLATLAQRGPGVRADRPEEAVGLLADTSHIRKLLGGEGRRDAIVQLVDEAASLRSKVSGSPKDNATRAIGLLREALAREEEWAVLTDSGRALIKLNLANALSQLRGRAPAEAGFEEVREAAEDAIAAAGRLEPGNAIAMQIEVSAGAVLIGLYTECTAAGRSAPAGLWEAGRDVLERGFAAMSEAFLAHHPDTLRAAVNLASAYGAVVDGEVADRDRCIELLTYVIEHARRHEAEFRHAAAVNLAQLRVGAGEWEEAAEAYEIAAEAQRWLLGQARTPATRLGEIVAGSDLASRRALALAMAERLAEAVAVLEENRARLASGRAGAGDRVGEEDRRRPGRATVHLTTSSYATLGIIELPGGALSSFVTELSLGALAAAMRILLEARNRDERSRSLMALTELLGPGVVEPLAELLRAAGEPVEQLALVACGGLTSAPLHCVPDAHDRTLAESYELRNLVSSGVPLASATRAPGRAVAVVDPDGTLPFARAEREALAGWAGAVLDPPADRPLRSWLMQALGEVDVAHIACHARLDPEDPMRSSFALGGDSELSVADLAGLDSAELDLLVAPACQAASASPDAPDELLGIGHVLIHAGARVVIASLWDADDAATALVVARLYRELAAGAVPAVALSGAQRFVATLSGEAMSDLARERMRGGSTAAWLPYDLAIELLALSGHPKHRGSAAVFGDPAEWAALSCLEA